MSVFGIHEQSLLIREQRSSILASNLTHADTPHYKARDLNFSALLSHENDKSFTMNASHYKHFAVSDMDNAMVIYRPSSQDSYDENTVDAEIERKQFSENSLRYLSTLNFIKNKSSILTMALKEIE